MGTSVSDLASSVVFLSDQPVIAFLGLKRHQWPQRFHFEIIARDYLESIGATVLRVECYKKTKQYTPYMNPSEVNVLLCLESRTSVKLIS